MNNKNKTIKDLKRFCDSLCDELQEHLCPEFSIPATHTVKEYLDYRRKMEEQE